MIGNDIVDLAFATRHHNWRRPGYLEKIFTANEQRCIRHSQAPDRLVWTLWSAKESVYKVGVQAGLGRKYAPKKLHTQCLAPDDMTVEAGDNQWNERMSTSRIRHWYCVHYEGQKYRVVVEQGEGYVHSMARLWRADFVGVRSKKMRLYQHKSHAYSIYLKRSLCQTIAQEVGGEARQYQVCKNERDIPYLSYDNKPLWLSLTLSHHGRFGAFAFAGIGEKQARDTGGKGGV